MIAKVPAVIPDEAVTLTNALPEPVIVFGLRTAVRPVGVEAVRDTVPLNPFSAVTLTAVVTKDPGDTSIGFGEAVKLKSTTDKATTINLTPCGLPVPVTFRL